MSDSDPDPVLAEPTPSEDGTLLLECLALDHGERRAALDELCRQHPERAGALRELYSRLDDFGLIDEPVPEASLDERFGPYRLLGTLGSGGMGVVYLAIQEALGRKVALKVIQPGHKAPPRARERFRREAQAISLLDHPNICPVYDAGEVDGVPYLALRYVEGETLQQRLDHRRERDTRGDVDATIAIGEQLARALHAAHERGLVHRDVKPGNVMLEARTGRPLLLDFGLARLDDGDSPALTLSTDKVGTPAYMAPEQVAGQPTDRRTDVYALGATLYEALTLRPPHQAPTLDALYRRILAGEVTRAGRHDARIGRDLEVVLETALDRDPSRRYATAEALADDLRRVQRKQPILARRAGPVLRLKRFAQRNPVAAGFVGFLLVAVVAFAVLLQQNGALLIQKDGALATATANEQALRSREMGRTSPRKAVEQALAAVNLARGVGTISALHAAVVQHHEAAQMAHEQSVWVAAFRPQGDLVLSCSEDGTARLWNRHGDLQAELRHGRGVYSAEFDPTGELIVTASLDGTVALWNARGDKLHVWPHGDRIGVMPIDAIAKPKAASVPWVARFSADGRRIVTACSDRRARVFDVATKAQIGPDFVHKGMLMDAVWSTDGRIATIDSCGEMSVREQEFELKVWRPGVGRHEILLERDLPDSIMDVAFDAAGGRVAVACRNGNAYVFDVDAQGGEPVVMAHRGAVWRLCFSPDGDRILTSSFDNTVNLWSSSGVRLYSDRQQGQVADVRFVQDGSRILTTERTLNDSRILTTARDNTIRLYDAELNELLVLRGHSEWPWMAQMSPDGRQIASAGWDNSVRLWGLVDPRVPLLLGHTARVRGLARCRDGSILSVADDRTLRRWDLSTGAAHVIELTATPIALVPDAAQRSVLVAHEDGVARRYDIETGAVLAEYPDYGGIWINATFLSDGRVVTAGAPPRRRVFDADGSNEAVWGEGGPARNQAIAHALLSKLVATVGWGPNVVIWRESAEPVADFPIDPMRQAKGAASWSYAVAFSPREDRIVVGSGDNKARVFDLRDGKPIDTSPPLVLDGHDGSVLAVAWSPDGTRIATGSTDGAARLWDAVTGELLAVLRGLDGKIHAVLFLEDGRLLTAGDEGGIQTWLTDPDELIELARARIAR